MHSGLRTGVFQLPADVRVLGNLRRRQEVPELEPWLGHVGFGRVIGIRDLAATACTTRVVAEDTSESVDESSGTDDEVGQCFPNGEGLRQAEVCEDGEENEEREKEEKVGGEEFEEDEEMAGELGE